MAACQDPLGPAPVAKLNDEARAQYIADAAEGRPDAPLRDERTPGELFLSKLHQMVTKRKLGWGP